MEQYVLLANYEAFNIHVCCVATSSSWTGQSCYNDKVEHNWSVLKEHILKAQE